MPIYVYECADCAKAFKGTVEEYDEAVLFETFHVMEPTKKQLLEAITCPRCEGTNCSKSYGNMQFGHYVRGKCWTDLDGARRDMHKYKVNYEDPYKEHRMPGEVDQISSDFTNAGKRPNKQKHYIPESVVPRQPNTKPADKKSNSGD